MRKIATFNQYIQKTYESSGYNNPYLSPGYGDEDSYEPEDLRGINPIEHDLKLLATDYQELAILEDKGGKSYIFYFDSGDPEFQENYCIFNDETEEYERVDDLGVEAAANAVPEEAIGMGIDSWEKAWMGTGKGDLIEIDEELADDLIEEFQPFAAKDRRMTKILDVLDFIANKLSDSNESEEYEESETSGKPGYEESETDEVTEVMEGEGIHPAIRQRLMDYLKENPDATFPEAKKHISEKIAGWKLSEEDFDEAKKSM